MDQDFNTSKGIVIDNKINKDRLIHELTNEYGYDFHTSKKSSFDVESIIKKLPNKVNLEIITEKD